MDDVMTVGKAYAFDLLQTWNRIKTVSEENRALFLQFRIDHRKYSEYIALMTSLWMELYPKVKGRTEFGTLSDEFDEYREDFVQPAKTYISPRRAMKLQMLLRQALEKLRITDFEGQI